MESIVNQKLWEQPCLKVVTGNAEHSNCNLSSDCHAAQTTKLVLSWGTLSMHLLELVKKLKRKNSKWQCEACWLTLTGCSVSKDTLWSTARPYFTCNFWTQFFLKMSWEPTPDINPDLKEYFKIHLVALDLTTSMHFYAFCLIPFAVL